MVTNELLTASYLKRRVRPEKIRILLADDTPAMLDQICGILKDRFTIVAAFTNGEAVLNSYAALMPDVIILDISMGEMNGLEVAKLLRERGCRVPIVFLTVHRGSDFVEAAMDCGATGYVLKLQMKSDLVSAIRSAMAGDLFISASAV